MGKQRQGNVQSKTCPFTSSELVRRGYEIGLARHLETRDMAQNKNLHVVVSL
jgi:hypothetical protein